VDALQHSESIFVARSPQELYDMVSDVPRTGEWSPTCTACWWDEGAGPVAGSWFTGRNQTAARTWETRSQVLVADPGREFTFVVGGSLARWSYTLSPAPGGTELTESWHFLPDGIAVFDQRYGDRAEEEVADRVRAARSGIPATLAAIKAAAEGSG
jgi:hypothetical protein